MDGLSQLCFTTHTIYHFSPKVKALYVLSTLTPGRAGMHIAGEAQRLLPVKRRGPNRIEAAYSMMPRGGRHRTCGYSRRHQTCSQTSGRGDILRKGDTTDGHSRSTVSHR